MAYGFDQDKNKVEVLEKSQAGEVSNLKTSNKSNIVAAVNEVFQFANDGKAKLATAIGSAITNSGVTPPRPSSNSTWDQMVNGLLKIKVATLEANDFSVSVKEEEINGSKTSGGLKIEWNYTRYTHTTSKIQIPFSNVIFIIGMGSDSMLEAKTVPIGPNNGSIRNGFGCIGSGVLSYSKTTESGKNYLQLNVKTVLGNNKQSPEATTGKCGRMKSMSFVIVGY